MFAQIASIFRKWFSSELSIAGRQIYVVDDSGGLFTDAGKARVPIERVLGSFLRTRSGNPLEFEFIHALPLAEKTVALEAVVKRQSRLFGIAVMEDCHLRRFLADIKMAVTEEALNDLAQRFDRRWHEINYVAYVVLRTSASATLL
jgi:hypothetical protein